MPVPKWMAKVNKRVFNPLEIKRGDRPVLRHVGRTTGKVYRTPLDAHPIDGGYIFILMYGSDSDWVRNVLAGGAATLQIEGTEVELVSPVVLSKEDAWELMPSTIKPPAGYWRVNEYLQMDIGP